MKIRNLFSTFSILLSILILVGCGNSTNNEKQAEQKAYETIENDPTNTRIYTLDNGLKVYLSVNKTEPRVQTSIAIRAGSKNDPSDATGLAHYLEHMLFKGTDKYGTSNFSEEAPLLAQIDSLYEVYRNTDAEAERKVLYAQIDSISQIASTFAIANEYDKMVSEMGAKGTNAYTSQERTVYVNDIPSNQLEKWLKVEAERFRNPQMRLFHTELEAVYEEKNRTLDNDGRKVWYALFDNLFPTHQYGQQTTIGTIDHLKNPSIQKIKEYFNTYYVPNNMAICLAGDFDPAQVYEMIKTNFGGFESKEVPEFQVAQEKPITEPIVTSVVGPDAESMRLAYRFDGVDSKESRLIQMCDMILSNRTAGIMDLNLNQKQKVLGASSFTYVLSDYSSHIMYGRPKAGQSLEEVKDLLLAQIDSLKAGAFPDWLPEACINDMKKGRISQLQYNGGRTSMMVNAFIQKRDWENEVGEIDSLKKFSKEDIVQFANEHYKDNYVAVYKKTGVDTTVKEVEKPAITPINVNRDTTSAFLTEITTMPAKDIEPVFLDYDTDVNEFTLENGITVRSVMNEENGLFSMNYLLDMGSYADKKMAIAVQYLPYLGTSKYSPAEIQQEFYKIGCDFNVYAAGDRTYVTLSGLNENFEAGVKLFEHLISDAQPEEEALGNMIADVLKKRKDAKLSKGEILYGAMSSYGKYGSESPYKNILSESELKALSAQELVDKIKGLTGYEHRVLYYGPLNQEELSAKLMELHQVPAELKDVPEGTKFTEQETNDTKVYYVDYDMKQAEIYMMSKKEIYNPQTVAAAAIYNEYFGGGMGSIVFQEMRESKALAYSVYSFFSSPGDSADAHYVIAYIGTQVDKLEEAMEGMTELLDNMPESENAFELAKKSALEKIRTERITRSSKLWNYETALKRGVDKDLREEVYRAVPAMTMEDLKAFHEKYVKNGAYNIMVIGDKKKLNTEVLKSYGPLTQLSLEEVFGY